MKTTMELPDPLLAQLRRRASAEGVSMRDITLEALRRELARREADPPRVDFSFPTSTAVGWLVDDLDLTGAIEASYR